MSLFSILTPSLTAFAISFLVMPTVIKTAIHKGLVDKPGGRKQHERATPVIGGVAVFIGILTSLLFWLDGEALAMLKLPLAGTFLLAFLGLKDDMVEMKAKHKLLVQLVIGSVIGLSPLRVHLPAAMAGNLSYALFIECILSMGIIVLLTNAYNLIDGINGLAAGIGIIASSVLAWLFFQHGDGLFAMLGLTVAGALLAYLPHNFPKAKTFMGDNGSLVIGFLLSIMGLRALGMDPGGSSIPISLAAVAIPLLDTFQVILRRFVLVNFDF
ncbi:MAG: MraY family glycosyltransferase [Bacteroidia bacterium]